MVKSCLTDHGRKNYNHKERLELIQRIVKRLTSKKESFDAIAVSGYSMALVGTVVAYSLEKNLILVRKECDKRYSEFRVEGTSHQRYIIIDDFMETGETIKRVVKEVNQNLPGCVCVAVGTYDARLTLAGTEFCRRHVSELVEVVDLTEGI